MSLNVDKNLEIKKQAQQQVISAEIQAAQIEIPIGKQDNTNADLYAKLGITQEVYMKLCSETPNFATLSFDEQLKYIQSQPKVVEQPAAAITTEKNETLETTVTDTTVDMTMPALSKNAIIAQYGIDKSEYNKMSIEDKLNTYASELARNKFLYGDPDNQEKTNENWNALSNEERQKLIAQAKEESLNINDDTRKLFGGSTKNISKFLDTAMTDLQTASFMHESLEYFNKNHESQKKLDLIHQYLNDLRKNAPDQLSETDKNFLKEHELLLDALKDATGQDNLSVDDIDFKLQKLNKTSVEIKYEYLKKTGKTDSEEFKFLEGIVNTVGGQEILKAAQRDKEDIPLDFSAEIGYSDYGDSYNNAKSSSERAFIVNEYLNSLKGDKEKFKAGLKHYLAQCNKTNIEEINEVIGAQVADHQTKELLGIDSLGDFFTALNIGIGKGKVQGAKAGSDYVDEKENKNPDQAEQFEEIMLYMAQGNPDSDVSIAIGKRASDSASQKNQEMVVRLRNIATSSSTFNQYDEAIEQNSDVPARRYAAETLHLTKMDDQTKLESQERHMQGNPPDASIVKIYSRDVNKYSAPYQTKAAQTVMTASEKLNKKDAMEAQEALADQIQYCAAQNQAEIHKMVSQSQYEEVVQHAAENIYKYDASAQKEALKYTLQTGNEKAIESAISNIDKCKGLTNETSAVPSNKSSYDAQLAKEIKYQQEKIEQKYIQFAAEQYADYMVTQDIRRGAVSQDEAKTTREKYIEEFKNPSSNKFALLGKLEPSLKREALKILVKFAPNLINSFIDMGYGEEILRAIGETSDLAEKIIKLMDFKGQPEAKEIVMKHPDKFEDLYLKYVQHDENPPLAHSLYTTPPQGITSFLKSYNMEGKIIFKT